jgi:hypothetical protein
VTASWTAATAPPVAPRELAVEPGERPAPLVERGAVAVPTPTDVSDVAAIRTTLRLTDSLGGTATAERTVWTHVLEGPNPAVLLNRVLQQMTNLTAIPLDVLEGGGPPRSTDRRHGSIVRTAATRATADNRLSIDECRSLATLADGIRKARAGGGDHP